MKKRILSLALTFAMMLSILPLDTFTLTASAATSGTTGDCTWTLDGTVLTISGEGEMRDYNEWDDVSSAPWGTDITEVIIEKGVKSIGDCAFRDCSSLTSITIPDSVTSIGYDAFSGCDRLKYVYITDLAAWCNIDFGNVNSNPLYYADILYINGVLATDLVIPSSVTSIGSSVFYGCSSLTSVTIPDSVTSIGSSAFYDCTNLKDVYITDLTAWCNIDFENSSSNPLYHDGNLYINGVLATDIVIPRGVTSIKNYAFYGCTSLTNITLLSDVTSISNWAFYGCTKLANAIIPDSVESIDNSAFHITTIIRCNKNSYTATWCQERNGQLYCFIDGTDQDCVVSGIVDDFAWSLDKRTGELNITGSGNLTDFISVNSPWYDHRGYVLSLEISEGVTKIGERSFVKCYNLRSATIPDSVESIGSYAFLGCTNLTSIKIPADVKKIGEYAFCDCSSLTSITIPLGVTSIQYRTFYGCSGLISVTIPSGVTSIGDYAFFGCANLTNITVPSSVESIGDLAFCGCSSLTNVTIGNSVTSIGYDAFLNCSNLKDVIIFSKYCSLYGNCGLNYNHTIYGFKGSDVETFADSIGANFIDIETIHTHTFGQGEVTVPATCKDGIRTYSCTHIACGETKTEPIPAIGHTPAEAVKENVVTAKCKIAGSYDEVIYCTVCNEELNRENKTTEALGHKEGEVVVENEVAAECEKAGSYENVVYCTVCNTELSRETITTDALGHTEGEVVVENEVAAYCENKGSYDNVVYCTVCNEELNRVTKEISALKHDEVALKAVAATCTATGLTAGKQCSVCGVETVKQTVVPALGHKEVALAAVAATYEKTGLTAGKKCSVCNTVTVAQKVVPALAKTSVKSAKFTLKAKTYTGKALKQSFTVKLGSKTLKSGVDYTISYKNNKNIGKATVTIKGIGAYKDYVSKTFKINPKKLSSLKVKAGKKQMTVSFKKDKSVGGYEILYATSKNFKKGKKTIKIKSYKTAKKVISKLKSKKTYYVKVRSFKKVSGKTYYGVYTSAKKVKVK